MDWFDQFRGSDVETVGQLHDVEQTYVPLAALHSSNVVPVEIRQFR